MELLVTQQQQPNHRMTQELRYYTSPGFLGDCLSVFVNQESVQRDTGRAYIDGVCCWGELEEALGSSYSRDWIRSLGEGKPEGAEKENFQPTQDMGPASILEAGTA